MHISRRQFLKYACGSAAAIGLSSLHLSRLETVMADASSPPVIWLSGSGCTGCSVSLLNAVDPSIDQVLINTISLKYHPNLMATAGDMAVQAARSTQQAGGYVLVVEGAIPTASGGKYCYVWDEGDRSVTMAEAVQSLAASAALVVAVGSCASFGGIPTKYDSAGAVGVGSFLGQSVVNLSGCPPHPDWIVGSLVKALTGQPLNLDQHGRPRDYYLAEDLHERCPREDWDEGSETDALDDDDDDGEDGDSSVTFGIAGACLDHLGCKGKRTHADCDRRLWNNGQGYCIGVNGLCIGCTEPDFPAFPLHRPISVSLVPSVGGPYKVFVPSFVKGS